MDGFLSFLLFAVLFYVMMRFGCGAHMVHGRHGGHGDHGADEASDAKHEDPVCGKHVSPNEGYGKMHADRLYRFCSRQRNDQKTLARRGDVAIGGIGHQMTVATAR